MSNLMICCYGGEYHIVQTCPRKVIKSFSDLNQAEYELQQLQEEIELLTEEIE